MNLIGNWMYWSLDTPFHIPNDDRGMALQVSWPLLGIVVLVLIVPMLFRWWRRKPLPSGQTVARPMEDPISFVGGGRWTKIGFLGQDARWPSILLMVGRDGLYYGPNNNWPLAHLIDIPEWYLRPSEVRDVTRGPWGIYLKLVEDGVLVFTPIFVDNRSILEKIAARGYPVSQSRPT